MLEFEYIVDIVIVLVYGHFICIGMKKFIEFNLTQSEFIVIKIGNFFMGYLFAMLTRNIWFIVFPLVLLIALILKIRCNMRNKKIENE